MNYGKQGLKVLGISLLAALGLMAFGAGGASASGSFLIEGLSTPWTASISGIGTPPSKLFVLGLNIEISCDSVTISGAIKNSGHGHATITLLSCLASGTNSAGWLVGGICTLTNTIVANALILVILHNSKPYLLFTPLDGLTFASVNGSPCIPNATVKGSFVADISLPDEDNLWMNISAGWWVSGLFWNHTLKYGVNSAHLTFEAGIALSGAHLGRQWGAA